MNNFMNQFTIAQNDGPGLPGQAAAPAASATTGAPSTAQGAQQQPAGSNMIMLVMFGVLAALIISSMLSGRKEKKTFEEMLSNIKKHDRVRTTGGIIGSVVEVKPDVVVLKVDENSNTKITVVRASIAAVMKETTTGTA